MQKNNPAADAELAKKNLSAIVKNTDFLHGMNLKLVKYANHVSITTIVITGEWKRVLI